MKSPVECNQRLLWSRGVVFALASLSFACLLGQFYNFWTMRFFGCWILPPAAAVLCFVAWRLRRDRKDLASAYTWIVQGAIGGIIAAFAYDLYRLPFVLRGAPLFKVFPRFGELLLGSTEPRWLVHSLGWTYHLSNGIALGIMFLAVISVFKRPPLFIGAILWALTVEALLLLTPYPAFLEIKLDVRFLLLTVSAHLIFGIVLGAYCKVRSSRDWRPDPAAPAG